MCAFVVNSFTLHAKTPSATVMGLDLLGIGHAKREHTVFAAILLAQGLV